MGRVIISSGKGAGWMLNKKTGEVVGLDANRKAKVIVKTIEKK
tara:strand:- start:103 stop:231 length:129 start_codon:yes stop_codon:yes gene_type:complete